MKKMVALTLALLMAASLFLSGCSVRKDTSDSENSGSSNGSGSGDRVVNVCSWGEYIDESLIDQFEEATGIKVNYQTAESNEVLYSQLSMGGVDYDVIVPSDYMISQLIEEDMLAELNYDNIPNFEKIDDRFKNLSYDPENKYTVPYTWGTTGIIYNSKYVDEADVTGWELLWNEKYAGKILMFDNSRDAFGIAEYLLGYSVNSTDSAELQACADKLAEQKPVVQQYVMDQIFDKMINNEAAMGTYYAGDYLTMLENNGDLAFVVPEEGSNWFVDAMCVLKSSQHKDEAMEWINFIAGTDASLANMDYIWYASPNAEALETYPAYYEETYGEPLDPALYEIMAPSQEVLDRCEAYLVLPAETRTLYNDLWTQLGI